MDPIFTLAMTTRALYRLEEEEALFQRSVEDGGGVAAYRTLQRERMEVPPEPGVAFTLARKLSDLNREVPGTVRILLVSRNDAVTGCRALHAAKTFGLDIEAGSFSCGDSPTPYLTLWQPDLFLTADPKDVALALAEGFAAGLVWPSNQKATTHPDQIRVAFDADAVLFDGESESFCQRSGGSSENPAEFAEAVTAFRTRERMMTSKPMRPGPLKPFLEGLHRIQKAFPNRVRTAIFTARDALALERCLRTLGEWGIDVDEAFPLAGGKKAPFLEKWQPDLYLDDQARHCGPASELGIPTVQVPGFLP